MDWTCPVCGHTKYLTYLVILLRPYLFIVNDGAIKGKLCEHCGEIDYEPKK